MKKHTLDEVQDRFLGKKGTPSRDRFEYELRMDIVGKAIREARRRSGLTQEELGVFNALQAKVRFEVELGGGY